MVMRLADERAAAAVVSASALSPKGSTAESEPRREERRRRGTLADDVVLAVLVIVVVVMVVVGGLGTWAFVDTVRGHGFVFAFSFCVVILFVIGPKKEILLKCTLHAGPEEFGGWSRITS